MTEGRDRTPSRTMDEHAAAMYKAFLKAALIAGVFTLVVLGLLVSNHYKLRASDPRNSTEIKALKSQLRKHPKDEKIKARVRQADLRMRRSFLQSLDFAQKGNYVLLFGIVGLLVTISAAAQYRKKIYLPEKGSQRPDELRQTAMLSRRAVASLGMVVVGGFILLAFGSRGDLTPNYIKAVREYEKNPQLDFTKPLDPMAGLSPAMRANMLGRLPAAALAPMGPAPPGSIPRTAAVPTAAGVPDATAVMQGGLLNLPPMNPLSSGTIAPDSTVKTEAQSKSEPTGLSVEAAFDVSDYSPSTQEFAENWPVFRGAAFGVAQGNYPTSWNGQSGQGILWKTEVPLPGWNSPVVWKDRVFLAGADEKKREIYCFNVENGKLIWKQVVEPFVKGEAPDVNEETGYAASGIAVDGRRVFTIFPNGDVVCYDFEGKRLWGRNLGSPDSMYGYASSLAIFRSMLIIQYDHGSGDDGKSALIALQGSTGKVVWITKRPVANSWSSPIVSRSGDQGVVITCANPWTISYDALSGKELWRADLLSGDIAPSPSYVGGMAYVCNSGAVLAAIRADGHGDVTRSHVVWQASDGLPDITSPATDGELLFLLSTEGTATCYDAKGGKKLWERSYESMFKSSPVINGRRVYLLDADGVMHVVDAKGTFKEEGKSPLGETVNATPAFADGRIFIRGTQHLFCIGKK